MENGVKYTQTGGIIKATINEGDLKMIRIEWCGINPSKKVRFNKQRKIVECFESEDWLSIGVNEGFCPSIHTSRVNPQVRANILLPAGTTKACFVTLKVMTLTDETQAKLVAFGTEIKNTMGAEFRVLCACK